MNTIEVHTWLTLVIIRVSSIPVGVGHHRHSITVAYISVDFTLQTNVDSRLLRPVYTIQPVVKTVDNRLNVCTHDTTACQTRCQAGCQTGLTTGCIAYTNIQPVVKVWQNGCIVYTADCQTGCATRFDNRLNEQWLFVQHGCQTGLYNRFDNRLYRV